jgi:O-antigen ligase
VQFGWTRERADRTLLVLACAGTFYCLFGLVSHLAAPGRLLWLDAAYPDAVTATFVNRNTFATYAGITMVTLIALVTNLYRRAAEQGGGRRTRTVSNIIDATAGRAGLLLLAIVVTLAALFMSTSRGGVMASLVAVLFFAAMFAWRGWRQGGKVSFAVLGVSLVFLPVSLVVFGSSFVERLDRSGLESESRLPAYSIVWDSIKDSPLVGFGYGTFRSVFPMYRDQRLGVWGSWDKAHNTYLELAQGLGLPVAAIFVLAVVLVFVRVTRGAVGRRRFATSAFVASCATVLVGLHALVDFSLQIQAVALTWTALLGLGFAQSFSTRSSQSKPVGATAPRPAEWIR